MHPEPRQANPEGTPNRDERPVPAAVGMPMLAQNGAVPTSPEHARIPAHRLTASVLQQADERRGRGDRARTTSRPPEAAMPTEADRPAPTGAPPRLPRSARWRLAVALAGVAAVVVIVVVAAGGGAPAPATSASDGSVRPAVGPADADVVMEVWTDFGCSFCARHAAEVEGGLIDRYVEGGTLRIEWYDFPVQGRSSFDAAVAARAAGLQGRYRDYATVLYDRQPAFDRDELLAYADELGLDLDRFASDLDSPLLRGAVERDLSDGQARGVRATPTFLLNGQPVMGAQPASVFDEAILYLAGAGSHD